MKKGCTIIVNRTSIAGTTIQNRILHTQTLTPPLGGQGGINLYFKITDNEFLPFHRILTHVVLQQQLNMRMLLKYYRLKADIITDKPGKFIRRNFSQSLETRYFRFCSQFFHCLQFFRLAVTINCFLFVPYTKQRCFQNVYMTIFHQVREKLQEESHQQ